MNDPVNQWNHEWDQEQQRLAHKNLEITIMAQAITSAIGPQEMEEALVGPFLSAIDLQTLTTAYHDKDALIVLDMITKAVKGWALLEAENTVSGREEVSNYGGTE